jgi:hypothetical protein
LSFADRFTSGGNLARDKELHTVQQNFHGAVGNVAGRDVVQQNPTFIAVLAGIQKTVEQSANIPEADKPGILEHLKLLAANPWVAGIASGEIVEGLKKLFS